jgi:diguanylate cyclase (GGDEF)-like protein
MREESINSQIYILIVVFLSLLGLFELLMHHPESGINQILLWGVSLWAIFMEMIAPSLPYSGWLTTANGFYLFMILIGQPQTAVVVGVCASALRSITRDRGPWLLRFFFPFQRLLCIETASLPVLFNPHALLKQENPIFLMATAPLYFILDSLLEGTAAGFILLENQQKPWFKARYRSLVLSFVSLLLGAASAFLINNPFLLAVLLLSVVLLQFAAASSMQKEVLEATSPLIEDLEHWREEAETWEKKYQETRQQVAQKTFEMGLLLDFGRQIGNNLELDNIFHVLLEIFKKLFRYQTCIVFFAEKIGNETLLVPKRYYSPYEKFCENLRIRFGETIVGAAAKWKQGFLAHPQKPREFSLLIENEPSEMAAPLIVQDKSRGVIYVGQGFGGVYTDADLQIFTTIAYHAAIVLDLAQSHEDTIVLATTDGLTGLYTHRYFQERLLEEFKRSEREHQPLSLIMLDLDHFKEYNDTYGHPMGDDLLKRVSAILKECTREYDIVCRYGGDEFSILLTGTTKETAIAIARRIREAVELRINADPRTRVKITTSIGVATFPDDASSRPDLLLEADKALYESKHRGRNRVVAAKQD